MEKAKELMAIARDETLATTDRQLAVRSVGEYFEIEHEAVQLEISRCERLSQGEW